MKALTLVEPKKFAIIEKDIPVATGNKVVIKIKEQVMKANIGDVQIIENMAEKK